MSSNINSTLEKNKYLLEKYKKVRYWCQDESRFGLNTIRRRKITAKGIKPKGVEQWKFLYRWLYGLIEPISGNNFFWEFTHLNSVCFEIFLDLFSEHYPDELHIIQLNNGALHKALTLNVPENIILLFQPPMGLFIDGLCEISFALSLWSRY